MADSKVTELAELLETEFSTSDVLPIVDVSATQTKKATINSFDQRYLSWDQVVYYFDDFLTANALSNYGWTASNGNGGAVDPFQTQGVDGTENCQGVIRCNSGTSSNGRAALSLVYGMYIGGTWTVDMSFRLALSDLSDGTDTYTAYMGVTENNGLGASESAEGIYFRYTHGTNSGKWQAVLRTGSSDSVASDTGVTGGTTNSIFRILIDGATPRTTWFIDGVQVATTTSALPSMSGTIGPYMKILKSAGTNARYVYLDWWSMKISRPTAR